MIDDRTVAENLPHDRECLHFAMSTLLGLYLQVHTTDKCVTEAYRCQVTVACPITTPQYIPSPRLMIAETPDSPPTSMGFGCGVSSLAAFGR